MHGALPRLRLSHKKTTYASEQDTYRIARQRHEFRHGRWRVDPRKWVIVDDSGINLGMALEQCGENGSGASSPEHRREGLPAGRCERRSHRRELNSRPVSSS